ncbi:MAG: chorismate synthase [Oscillospiraceae bacterium]
MSSNFGTNIKIQLFGQSHSEEIGVVIDGLPAGERIDMDEVMQFMKRRAPGQNAYSTKRKETDKPQILSGLVDEMTCGAPLCATFKNSDTHSQDYDKLRNIPRPSHADYPAYVKTRGFNDIRGGGHFSARLTAPLTFAGAVCVQLLAKRGIYVGAHIESIGTIKDIRFNAVTVSKSELDTVRQKDFAVIDDMAGKKMKALIAEVAGDSDSVGGSVECCVLGLPTGIGEPIFDGIENRISQAVFGIPAVKGIEFGAGFAAGEMRGSESNDAFYYQGLHVRTKTNNHGGILGGLASGMPVVFRAAFKPTPSIAREQQSVNLATGQNTSLVVQGRHDPCVVPRAVACVEAAAAVAIYDLISGTCGCYACGSI